MNDAPEGPSAEGTGGESPASVQLDRRLLEILVCPVTRGPLVVVVPEMGRDAQRAAADGDVDVVTGQAGDEVGRSAFGQAEAEEMAGAPRRVARGEAELGGAIGDGGGPGGEGFGDRRDAPGEDTVQRRGGRRQQGEVRRFPHVEAAGARAVVVAVVDEAGEVLGAGAPHPVLFERAAIAVARRDVEKAGGVGPEQPLVGGGDEEVGIDGGKIERERAGGLSDVEHESRADGAGRGGDGDEVEQGAVGPAAVRDRNDGGAGVDRGDHGGGQVAIRGVDGNDLGAGVGGAAAPG
jgi:uncharacterized protein YbaR (Trm112 family)